MKFRKEIVSLTGSYDWGGNKFEVNASAINEYASNEELTKKVTKMIDGSKANLKEDRQVLIDLYKKHDSVDGALEEAKEMLDSGKLKKEVEKNEKAMKEKKSSKKETTGGKRHSKKTASKKTSKKKTSKKTSKKSSKKKN